MDVGKSYTVSSEIGTGPGSIPAGTVLEVAAVVPAGDINDGGDDGVVFMFDENGVTHAWSCRADELGAYFEEA